MTDSSAVGAAPTRSDRYPAGPWTAAALGACACVAVSIVDPTRHMMSPPCPMRAITGWWCPFCGATRAASRLLRGDLTTALHFNAAFVIVLPVVALLWAAAAFPGRFAWLDPIRRRTAPITAVIVVLFAVFMVVRNTPFGDTWLRYPGA